MAFPEFEDFLIAAEAASIQMELTDPAAKKTLERHFDLFTQRSKDVKKLSPEALKIYQETIFEVPGAFEAHRLEGELVSFNLDRIKKNQEL